MATTDAGNLEIQQQLNELMAQRAAQIEKLNQLLNEQVRLTSAIRDAAASGSGLEKTNADLNSMSGALKDVAGKMGGLGKEIDSVTKQSLEMAPKLRVAWSVFASGINAVKKAFDTVIQAGSKFFSKTKDQLMSITGILKSVTRGFIGIGSALLSIPLTIMSFLQKKAADLANASLVLREAFEDVRDRFGDLASNEGKAVIDSYKDLTQQSNNLAGSGRSLSSIYGYGPEGLAAAMKDMAETAEAMGPAFSVLQDQFADNAAELTIMRKGLGLTNESFAALSRQAVARGEKLEDTIKEVANLSVQMGRKFGISSKLMGKDMSYMTSNMGKFGAMTKAQMATSAVYVRKLGLEIKDLEGVMGAFDDFESAATNASKMAQAFGMNIDAMKMMKEQDPSKRLDMLRKAFAATGKSIESMSRQEKALLAQTSGLDANLVEAALSAKNMGKSYDEIQAAAEGAADKQLTQEEIMQDMAKNIKKVFAPIEYVAGLLENFFNGFMRGLFGVKGEGLGILREIGVTLKAFFKAGEEVGLMLRNILGPELSSVGGLYKKLASTVKDVPPIFERFFKALKEGNTSGAVSGLIQDIKNLVTSFFGSDQASSLKDKAFGWMKMAFEFLAEAATTMLPEITNTLVEALDGLIAAVPEKIGEVNADGVKTPFMKLFEGLINLADKVVPKLIELFGKVFYLLFTDPKTRAYAWTGLALLLGFIFGPGLLAGITTLVGGLVTGLVTLLSIGFKIAWSSPTLKKAIIEFAEKAFPKIFSALGSAGKGLGNILLKLFTGPFEMVFAKLIPFVSSLFGRVGSSLLGFAGKFLGGTLLKGLFGIVSKAFTGPAGWVTLVVELVFRGLRMALETIGKDFFVKMGDVIGLGEYFGWYYDHLMGVLNNILDGLDMVFGGIWDMIVGLFTFDWERIGSGFLKGIKGIVSMAYGGLKSALGPLMLVIQKIAPDAVKGFEDWLKPEEKKIEAAASKAGEVAAQNLKGEITSGLDDVTKTAEEKLSTVNSMVGDYADKTTQEIALEGEKINRGLGNIEALLKQIDRAKMKSIEGLLDGLGTQFIEAGVQFFDSLSPLLDAYAKIANKLSEVSRLSFDILPIIRLSQFVGKFNETMSGVATGGWFSSSAIQTSISTSKELSEAMYHIHFAMKQMEAIQSIPLTAEKTYANVVQAIVEDVKAVNKSLNELGDIDINATVAKVGAKLGIKDEVIRIERKPIEMNVKFNLTLKADDVAKEIFDAAYKIATTTPGEGTVSPGRGITRAMIE